MIKVLVADRYPIMAEGISQTLKKVNGIKVIGTVSDHQKATNILETKKVDIIVLELKLLDDNGIDLYQKVMTEFPTMRILLHTEYSDWFLLFRLYREGVKAMLSKRSHPDKMAGVVFGMMDGKTMIDSDLEIIPWMGKTKKGRKVSFTMPEIKILKSLLISGDWEIVAKALQMKPNAVKYHRRNLHNKLGTKTPEETLQAVGELNSAFSNYDPCNT